MDTHESEHRFVVEDQFLCLCLTWNINGKRYDVMRDNDIIYSEAFQCRLKGIPNPDVVVVGLQETIELTATSVVGSELTGKVSERTAHWENATLRALNYGKNKGKYCCLNVISMLGLWMGVYATVEMAPYVVNCQVTSLARGAGGVIGNKGAVYFRATILSTSICFVCAHLPANREKLRKRNEEFFVIMNSKVFRDNSCSNQDLDLDTFVASGESIKIRQDQSSIRSRLQDLESRMLSNVSTSRAGKNSTADIDVEVISNDGKDDPERNAVLDRQVKSIEFLDEDLEDESLDTSFVGESNSGIAQESPLDTTFKRSDVSLEKVSERTHDRVTPLTSISEEKFRYSAWSHNIVIFLGDLNYRISQELDIHQVYSMIDTGNMEELLTYDQLLQEKDKGNVFPLFQEGVIMFPPTYKFIPGHNIYDRRPDKKLRIPAWCDRILWTTSSDLDLSMSKFDQKGSRNAISVDFICSNPASGKKVGTSASPLSYLNNNGDDLLDTPSSQSNDDDGIPPGQIEWNSDSIYYQMLDNQAKQLSVEKVELLLYESLPEFIISDHKPVRALMNIRMKSLVILGIVLVEVLIIIFPFDMLYISINSIIFFPLCNPVELIIEKEKNICVKTSLTQLVFAVVAPKLTTLSLSKRV